MFNNVLHSPYHTQQQRKSHCIHIHIIIFMSEICKLISGFLMRMGCQMLNFLICYY